MIRTLISCVMPTRGRVEFARASIAQFLAQTHQERELVIADDPECPSFDVPPVAPGVRYLVAPAGISLGAKRNWVNTQAHGPIIAHWDDDDWYASHRLAEQYSFLLHSGADLIGYREVQFWAESGAKWLYRGRPDYVIDSSAMYWRTAWETRPFPDKQVGFDGQWQRLEPRMKIATIPAGMPFIATNHAGNCSPREDETLAKHDCWERLA